MANANRYQLVLKYHLGPSWRTSLAITALEPTYDANGNPVTGVTLQVVDQAELLGVLSEIHANGIELVSLQCIAECTE